MGVPWTAGPLDIMGWSQYIITHLLTSHGVRIGNYIYKDKGKAADHSGRAILGMNCLHSLKHWDRGFKSHSSHGCLCARLLCLCCPVCR
jgi:hypothetical protein